MFVKWKAVLALAVAAATVAGFPCLAAAEDYELLVVSSASNQVLRTDPDGHYLGAFTADPGLKGPLGIAVGPNGKVYVSVESAGRAAVRRYASDGVFEQEYYAFSLTKPFGVVLDASNNLYVSSYEADEVVRWLASGAYDGTFASSGGMDGPAGISFGPDGKLLVACDMYDVSPQSQGRILKFTSSGGYDSQIVMDNLNVYPSHVVTDQAGDIYVLVTISKPNNAVIRYTSAGVYKGYYTFPGISAPAGLALRPGSGQVYVTGEEGVYRWDEVVGQQLVIASGSHGLARPFGIAFRPLQADSRNTITYQGRLTNPQGQPVADGTYQIVVRFFDVQSGGTALWGSPAVSASVKGGLFAARISKVPAAVFSARNVWMETEVNGETIAPRRYLGSVPLAIAGGVGN